NRRIILLSGGLCRANAFDIFVPAHNNVIAMIVFGETAEKLEQAAKEANISTCRKTTNMKEATKLAYEVSEEADVVLLSPACASWDQYKTFEERGDMFIQAVHTLK